MKGLALAVLAVCAAGCRNTPAPNGNSAGFVDFASKNGTFFCRAPAGWKTVESDGPGPLVMFLGPADAVISVSRYPDGVDRIRTPEDYLRSLKLADQEALDLQAKMLNGRRVRTFRLQTPRRAAHGSRVLAVHREDIALIPLSNGFFEIVHAAPEGTHVRTLPFFHVLVGSFRPEK